VNARRVAWEVVRRTFDRGAYTDRAFPADAQRAGLDARERRQAMRLAYGTVQRLRTLDAAIEELGGRPPMRLQAPLRHALRVSAYELLFDAGVPARAAVSEGVELARAVAGERISGLANAVLRRISEAPEGWLDGLPLAVRLSYPDWVIDEWTALLGAVAAEQLGEAQNRPSELAVRVNTLGGEAPDLGVCTHGDPDLPEALVLDEPLDVLGSDAFRRGLIWPQSRSSMQVGRLVAPEPGMRVLDLCAAPGGKSGHLAALMENRGELVCVERHPGRAEELRRTLRRLGVTCARVEVADVLDVAGGGYERILLDPPCSGLGVLSGRPDARWRRQAADVPELAGIQSRMLEHARGLLAPGGQLVYSVCTLTRAEGEGVLARGRMLLPQATGSDGFYVAVT
jgi:16S rRNA (cytosine967-C5)-methyltransferase